ncbi:MAG: hypothetical protein ACYDGN_15070 [Acidimicrobiales bacterium]
MTSANLQQGRGDVPRERFRCEPDNSAALASDVLGNEMQPAVP